MEMRRYVMENAKTTLVYVKFRMTLRRHKNAKNDVVQFYSDGTE